MVQQYHNDLFTHFSNISKEILCSKEEIQTDSGLSIVRTFPCSPNSTEIYANSTFPVNASGNASLANSVGPAMEPWLIALLALLAGCTSLVTVSGNLIVLLSFFLERSIRQPTNYFIASLAMSDLLIGMISMPFYTLYLLQGHHWTLGEFLCDLWLSVDYTLCLCSIYTVFCITIDRFCSVKLPARYREWRTRPKVLAIISVTWILPTLVFFPSIFGWPYIAGGRSIPPGNCYVQYMEDALFNCLLQIGYFWITLCIMCTLYAGIYRVALKLQHKSDRKRKEMTSFVSMAGQRIAQIGAGLTEAGGSHTMSEAVRKLKHGEEVGSADRNFNQQNRSCDHRESSSPDYPSDADSDDEVKYSKKHHVIDQLTKAVRKPVYKSTSNPSNKSPLLQVSLKSSTASKTKTHLVPQCSGENGDKSKSNNRFMARILPRSTSSYEKMLNVNRITIPRMSVDAALFTSLIKSSNEREDLLKSVEKCRKYGSTAIEGTDINKLNNGSSNSKIISKNKSDNSLILHQNFIDEQVKAKSFDKIQKSAQYGSGETFDSMETVRDLNSPLSQRMLDSQWQIFASPGFKYSATWCDVNPGLLGSNYNMDSKSRVQSVDEKMGKSQANWIHPDVAIVSNCKNSEKYNLSKFIKTSLNALHSSVVSSRSHSTIFKQIKNNILRRKDTREPNDRQRLLRKSCPEILISNERKFRDIIKISSSGYDILSNQTQNKSNATYNTESERRLSEFKGSADDKSYGQTFCNDVIQRNLCKSDFAVNTYSAQIEEGRRRNSISVLRVPAVRLNEECSSRNCDCVSSCDDSQDKNICLSTLNQREYLHEGNADTRYKQCALNKNNQEDSTSFNPVCTCRSCTHIHSDNNIYNLNTHSTKLDRGLKHEENNLGSPCVRKNSCNILQIGENCENNIINSINTDQADKTPITMGGSDSVCYSSIPYLGLTTNSSKELPCELKSGSDTLVCYSNKKLYCDGTVNAEVPTSIQSCQHELRKENFGPLKASLDLGLTNLKSMDLEDPSNPSPSSHPALPEDSGVSCQSPFSGAHRETLEELIEMKYLEKKQRNDKQQPERVQIAESSELMQRELKQQIKPIKQQKLDEIHNATQLCFVQKNGEDGDGLVLVEKRDFQKIQEGFNSLQKLQREVQNNLGLNNKQNICDERRELYENKLNIQDELLTGDIYMYNMAHFRKELEHVPYVDESEQDSGQENTADQHINSIFSRQNTLQPASNASQAITTTQSIATNTLLDGVKSNVPPISSDNVKVNHLPSQDNERQSDFKENTGKGQTTVKQPDKKLLTISLSSSPHCADVTSTPSFYTGLVSRVSSFYQKPYKCSQADSKPLMASFPSRALTTFRSSKTSNTSASGRLGMTSTRVSESRKKSKSANRAKKALRTITIILGAFVFCWTPWHVLSMIIGFCDGDGSKCVKPLLYDISYWLCYINSPINPFCYALANQQFRKTFSRILRLDWHRT